MRRDYVLRRGIEIVSALRTVLASIKSTSERKESNLSKSSHSATLGHTTRVVTGDPAGTSGNPPVQQGIYLVKQDSFVRALT